MKVADALSKARDIGVARLDAQLLIAHHLGRSRSWVLAHDDDALLPVHQALVLEDLGRLADGVPLAYIRKEREFHGLSLEVSPAVLVPRPDTEVLVDWALQLLSTRSTPSTAARVADLGTGSGAIALAVRHACPAAEVWATDLSLEALETARRNATRLKLQVEFRAGCWWAPLQGQCFDLLLSNPPYIASDDPHLAALAHEPREALTPGGDGLSALRTLVQGGPDHLVDGGWMLLEHGHEQAAEVTVMLREAGFEAIQTRLDIAGLPRCTGGRKPMSTVSR
jgi:release factor glutamine methyltransferase